MNRLVVLFLGMAVVAWGGVSSQIIKATLKAGAKKSHRVLTPALEKSMRKSLQMAVKNYGDDALKAVSKGGVELLELGGKYGDDVLRLCAKDPKILSAVAKSQGNKLVPLAARLGTDVLKFESKHPGYAVKAVSAFGDDVVKAGLKISHKDMVKLVSYGAKADSPATRKLLWSTYLGEKGGTKFLQALDWKRIMSTGLSASVITLAYKTGNGVESALSGIGDGAKIAATKAPQSFAWGMATVTGLVGLLILFPAGCWLHRKLNKK